MMSVSLFNQWSGFWAALRLTPSNWTMANSGCYITSLTMALPNWAILREDGTELNPGEVLEKLIASNSLNADGFLTYDGMMAAFPSLYFHDRIYTSNDPRNNGLEMRAETALKRIRRQLDLGQPTILCVDNLGNDGIPDHAVLAVDYIMGANDVPVDFIIHDPDGGKKLQFTEKYGTPLTKLYGYISIIGPPIEFPTQSTDKEDGHAAWKAAMVRKGINVKTYSKEILDALLSS